MEKYFMFYMMENVKDFDIGVHHIGILLNDGKVFNYNLLTPPEKMKNLEEYLSKKMHFETTPDVGALKMIATGDNFNLLVTENNELYIQNLKRNCSFKSLEKIDMISDYNSIHNTEVLYYVTEGRQSKGG
jgi:alpha-tubulin suppressor-like RCC1 family protein